MRDRRVVRHVRMIGGTAIAVPVSVGMAGITAATTGGRIIAGRGTGDLTIARVTNGARKIAGRIIGRRNLPGGIIRPTTGKKTGILNFAIPTAGKAGAKGKTGGKNNVVPTNGQVTKVPKTSRKTRR